MEIMDIIKSKAETDGQYAIAYAIMELAAAVYPMGELSEALNFIGGVLDGQTQSPRFGGTD